MHEILYVQFEGTISRQKHPTYVTSSERPEKCHAEPGQSFQNYIINTPELADVDLCGDYGGHQGQAEP